MGRLVQIKALEVAARGALADRAEELHGPLNDLSRSTGGKKQKRKRAHQEERRKRRKEHKRHNEWAIEVGERCQPRGECTDRDDWK